MSVRLDATSSIAERVRALRAERDITQAELGVVLGLDHTAVSRIEAGRRGLATPELVRLAQYFDVSADSMLFGAPADDLLFRAEGETKDVVAFAEEIVKDIEFVEALLA